MPAIAAAIDASDSDEWEHGDLVGIPKLDAEQAAKLAGAILQLQPPFFQIVWIYRVLTAAPGFTKADRAKLFDIFVQSKDEIFLPDAVKWIPDLSTDERILLEAAVAKLPNENA